MISIAWEIHYLLSKAFEGSYNSPNEFSNSPCNWAPCTLTSQLQSQFNKLGLYFPASGPMIRIFDTKDHPFKHLWSQSVSDASLKTSFKVFLSQLVFQVPQPELSPIFKKKTLFWHFTFYLILYFFIHEKYLFLAVDSSSSVSVIMSILSCLNSHQILWHWKYLDSIKTKWMLTLHVSTE